MRERLTVSECREYLEHHKPHSVHLHSNNQFGHNSCYTANLSFDTLVVVDNPDMVLLHSELGSVFFERIAYIEVDSETLVSATIINVVCNKERERYTLLVR